MPFYRKFPVVIEAMQYDGDNATDLLAWIANGEVLRVDDDIFIRTLEGDMKISAGDYVICGIEGEYYPCKPGIFDQTYGLVDDVYEVLDAFESRRVDL